MQSHPSTKNELLGRVIGLWRYPVKSMSAETLSTVDVSWHGLLGDRRWAFVRDGVPQSGFPWFTLRQRSDLNRYRPSFVDPGRPEDSETIVLTPDGSTYDITDKALAEELASGEIRVIRQSRGVFDTFPLSLITIQTIRELAKRVGTSLEVERFRPNVLVDCTSGRPFTEDQWVGSVLSIGGLQMRVDKRDGRCVVITIDPETGQRSPEVLRRVVEDRDGCLGVYGTTVEPGRVSLGDPVFKSRLDG